MGASADHERRTRMLERALARAAPDPGLPFPCPYLPDRMARHVTLRLEPLTTGIYHSLMDLNFRRLGQVFYRPCCPGCSECRAIRVPVDRFSPSRAQRRCLERNRELVIEWGPPRPDDEKQALYRRYLESRHDGQMDGSPAEFQGFLYNSPLETVEWTYRLGGALVGGGVVDVEPRAWSAVYFYFEPRLASRSLGIFNILTLIGACRSRGVPYLYLGYQVDACAAMSYKARFRPAEILVPGVGWQPR